MEFIQRLPFVLSISMAIIIGVLSTIYDCRNQEVYTRMLLGMLIFYVVGAFIRHVVAGIREELDQKIKEEELLKRKVALELQHSLQGNKNEDKNTDLHTLDLKADDNTAKYLYDDDFSPLKVSEIIKKTIPS